MKNTQLIQLLIAAVLSLAGIALLFLGTILAPQGEIHETVLIAFGEIATFAGSIIGIDYRYRYKASSDQKTSQPEDQKTIKILSSYDNQTDQKPAEG